MKIKTIVKTVINTGLALLALTSVILLVTNKSLDVYQYCFLFGTMCLSSLMFLGLNKEYDK